MNVCIHIYTLTTNNMLTRTHTRTQATHLPTCTLYCLLHSCWFCTFSVLSPFLWLFFAIPKDWLHDTAGGCWLRQWRRRRMRCALYNAGYFFSSGKQHRTGRRRYLSRLLLLLVSSCFAAAASASFLLLFALLSSFWHFAHFFLFFRFLFCLLSCFRPIILSLSARLPLCQSATVSACLCNAKNVFSASGFITMFSMYESKFNQFYHLFGALFMDKKWVEECARALIIFVVVISLLYRHIYTYVYIHIFHGVSWCTALQEIDILYYIIQINNENNKQ